MTSRLLVDKIEGKTTSGTIQMPAGHIIQITKSIVTGMVQATSATYVDTGHSLVITPKFANSQILLQHYAQGWQYNAGSPYNSGLKIKRGGTVILTNDGHGYSEDGTWNSVSWVTAFFDTTHNSTSALTYTLEISGNRARYNDYASAVNTTTFIAMEVAQ